MPVAGSEPYARERVHMRWAQRYNASGNVAKALAHFGRALEYREVASFGARKPERNLHKSSRAKPSHCRVCREVGELYAVKDTENGTTTWLCKGCANRVLDDFHDGFVNEKEKPRETKAGAADPLDLENLADLARSTKNLGITPTTDGMDEDE